jgi:hypothetical protein
MLCPYNSKSCTCGEFWFAERIGSKVEAVFGKDIAKNPVLFHSLIGPFLTQEECLLAVEKRQAAIDAEIPIYHSIYSRALSCEIYLFAKLGTIQDSLKFFNSLHGNQSNAMQ